MSEDSARLEMVHELHTAMYGSSWARPESPKQVWEMLLGRVADAFVDERALRAVIDAEIRAQIAALGEDGNQK